MISGEDEDLDLKKDLLPTDLVLLAPNHSNMHLHGLTPGYGSKPLGNHSQSGTETEKQITIHTAVYSEL